MAPKQSQTNVAPAGAKAKAKANAKEEKKQVQTAKKGVKGKLQASTLRDLLRPSCYIVRDRASRFIVCLSSLFSLYDSTHFTIFQRYFQSLYPLCPQSFMTLIHNLSIAEPASKKAQIAAPVLAQAAAAAPLAPVKKQKRKKAPDAPKKPMSAFFCFQMARRHALKIQAPDLNHKDIIKVCI